MPVAKGIYYIYWPQVCGHVAKVTHLLHLLVPLTVGISTAVICTNPYQEHLDLWDPLCCPRDALALTHASTTADGQDAL